MRLLAGIRVFDHALRLADRIEMSDGMRRPNAGTGYVPEAVLARGPWRKPTSAELALLGRRRRPPGRWSRATPFVVSVVKVDDVLASPFRLDACTAASSAADWARFRERVGFGEELERTAPIAERLHDARAATEPLTVFALVRKEPGLESVSFDPTCGEHVGLHFDNYDRAPFETRHRARNRLVVNFGETERYLVFVNLPMMKLRKVLGVPEGAPVGNWSAYLLRELVERLPDYPVVRMRIDPGEAYIAPTDHMIHDASTALGRGPDVSLHFIGRFV